VGRLLHHEAMPPAWSRRDRVVPGARRGPPCERPRAHRGGDATTQLRGLLGYLGPDAEIDDDLLSAIDRPMTKVIAVGEPPRPMELLAEARGRLPVART